MMSLKILCIVFLCFLGLILFLGIYIGNKKIAANKQAENKPKDDPWDYGKSEKTADESSFTISVRTGSEEYFTRIAGVQYHNGKRDVGGFLGFVRPEPDNKYDKNAVAVYRNDGRMVGHLPKEETRQYRSWSQKEHLPCVGYIQEGSEVPLFGRVKIIDTFKEETELIIAKYVRWLVAKYGLSFIPEGFTINTDKDVNNVDAWLECLDQIIEERENALYEEVDDDDESHDTNNL